MTSREQKFEQVFRLVSAAHDEGLTDEQRAELETLVSDDDEARDLYIELTYRTLDLEYWAAQQETEGQSERFAADQPAPRRSAFRTLLSRPTPLSMTIAAMVMILLITAMAFMAPPFYRSLTQQNPQDSAGEYGTVAKLTNVRHAVWKDESTSNQRGPFLPAGGRIALKSGLVDVKFHGGAQVTVQGPCDFVVDDADAGTLHNGLLIASVPPDAKGFRIETAALRVIDLGTQFGVEVTEAQDTVVDVIKGRVSAEPKSGRSHRAVQLVAGQSFHWEGTWQVSATSRLRQEHWQALVRASQSRRIAKVSIFDVSSELADGKFDRTAKHLVDSSGLTRAGHSPYPDAAVPGGPAKGNMWLTKGTLRTPKDPLPAHVTFDLGDVYELNGIHVWNYNEELRGLHTRGAREVEISVSPTDDPSDFALLTTESGNFTFPEATGQADYRGFDVPLLQATNREALEHVRLVRFTILSRHGPNPEEDDENVTGLSEVQFTGRIAERDKEVSAP